MKKLLLILFVSLTYSCSVEDDSNDCECIKDYYEIQSYVWFNEIGLPQTSYRDKFLYNETINCTDEVQRVFTVDNFYYNINCN